MKQRWAGVFGGILLTTSFMLSGMAQGALTDGLVGYWNFDNCTAQDGSGNGNNGTLKGGISCVDGKQSKALHFNGIDAYILVPYSSSLVAKDAVTIAAWVNVPDGNPAVIVQKGQSGDVWDYGMTVNSGLPGFRVTSGDAYISSTSTSYNTWQHFTIVLTNNSVKTYLNGSQINGSPFFYGGSGSSGSYLAQSSYGLQIGLGHPGEWLKGSLDELRVYNRALPADEIQQLATDQTGSTCDITTPYNQGYAAAQAACKSNPSACGITVSTSPTTTSGHATYNPTANTVHMPFLDVPTIFGGAPSVYEIDLTVMPNTNPLQLKLQNAKQVQ